MVPECVLEKIRKITIHHFSNLNCVGGFSFFDKDWVLLWKIGFTESYEIQETVEIAENEVIVGVKAKFEPEWQSVYTDF